MAIVTDFDFVQIVQENEEGIISREDFATWVRTNVPNLGGETPQECCVGEAVIARGLDAYDVYIAVCADPNVEPVGAKDSYLLDVTDSRVDLYKSDGAEWEIIQKSEIRDEAFVECSNSDESYVFDKETETWSAGDQPVQVDPGNPDSWPLAEDPYEFAPVVDSNGYMIGYVDQEAAHPIACEIGEALIIDGTALALGPVLSGVCDDPNTASVTAAGDYLLDVTVNPFNLFESDGTQWELIPRSTIADKTQFNCTNVTDKYLFDAPSMTWAEGEQPVELRVDDPSTWGTVSAPVKKRCVFNGAGELVGVVDRNGGHLIANPEAAVTGDPAPANPPETDDSGHSTPFYVQTNVANPQTEQNDLTILWYWNGSNWLRVNDLVLPAAREDLAGIVELATQQEVNDGTDTERAVTPATLNGRTATPDRTGLVELATQAEVDAGTDNSRAVTPATLNGRTATPDRTGLVELATQAEVDAGTDNTRAVTPATLSGALDSVACDENDVAAAAEIADPNNFSVLGCVGGVQKQIRGADLKAQDVNWDPYGSSGPVVRRLFSGPQQLSAAAGAPGGGFSGSVSVPNGVDYLAVREERQHNDGSSDTNSDLWLLPVAPGQTLSATHNDSDRSVTVSNGVWSYRVRASTFYNPPDSPQSHSVDRFSMINTAEVVLPNNVNYQAIAGESNSHSQGFGTIHTELQNSDSVTGQTLWWATRIG